MGWLSRFQLSVILDQRLLSTDVMVLILTELSNQESLLGVRSPLFVVDISIVEYMESKILISSTEFLETSLGLIEGLDPALGVAVAALQRLSERLQPRVELNDAFGMKSAAVSLRAS
jgi:hypothetical protein